MERITSRFKFAYSYIINSIGFYPSIISLFFFGLSLFMLYMEANGLSKSFKDKLPFMIITDEATARLILSSITTGIISLTVFSFTMVMLVLNQASANFTPRVIPGLISYKSNQRVLGLYLGTLIYTLVIMVNIHADYYSIPLPGFSIFLAMCFTILCLSFFVYFIHSISQSIQIESILESIYHVTSDRLNDEIAKDKGTGIPGVFDTDKTWHPLKSPQTGYIQNMDRGAVLEICSEYNVALYFEQPLGAFLVEGVPFARTDKPIDDMDGFTDKLFAHVDFFREERPSVNYLFGFKHITESAVKALSPGINDPGTAIKAIDYLTALFSLRMRLTDEKVLYDKKGKARIRFEHETFGNLYAMCLGPIRLYGKGSSVIVIRLLYLLHSLLYKVQSRPHLKPILYREALMLLHDADKEISNPGDRLQINHQVKQLNARQILDKELPLLNVSL
ncbi:DUF2254 domain-containing protein [Pontibacter akesuensis]|uniref:Uncharacterized membrane protein n=1 Tax=Pontibacter akesuensis TaxID=388950 RepID=A0A1I7G2Y0_9BACT|nr:DUF2254 domain-containing protein [Pontibacter akesuensis]GHA59196.1 hypothetical protein GCM10007389_09000 [Pontibacter akesuensis]SFU42626.1 Uncharacterized membrane protein [Pontibacter akesuensis]